MGSTFGPRWALFSTSKHLVVVAVVVSIFFLFKSADAQALLPTTTWGSAYTAQEGQKFIIQGGSNGTHTISQTFSIDLSTSWDTSSVPYTQLKNGPADYKHSATLIQDKQTWFMISNGTGYEYSLLLNSWKSLGGSGLLSKARGLGAITDSSSGLVYVPNGYLSNREIQMARYDTAQNTLNGSPMPPDLSSLVSYSIAWSVQAQKMVVYGGATGGTNNVKSNMYTWDSSSSWVVVTPQGDIPTPRRSACMVPAYNGAKMVLFGGLTDQSNSVLSDIYILDTATMTWKRGADAGAAGARAEAACTVSNDLFIAWGGGGVNTVISSNLTIIYNLKRDIWQSTYSPNFDSSPSGEDDKGSPGSGKVVKVVAVIFGVVGAVVILAVVIGSFLHCRRRKHIAVELGHSNNGTATGANATTGIHGQKMPFGPTQHEPWQQEPWQQQQGDWPLSMPMQFHQTQASVCPPVPYSLPYTTYQPPVLHDYQEFQQPPRIFQPHAAHQQPIYSSEDSGLVSSTLTPSTASVYSQSIDLHQRPTVYYPLESSITELTPELEYQPRSERPLQNPQSTHVFSGSNEDDNDTGHRRNPQGL
ncbi:hypothetical protein BGZ65_008527 [Modicella reniformis]|uniref:Galactose oxidase n=1 Tax=Modicella reniformis TaxID=1440133 RepID=A0A9P6J4S6_9FUNG|nr:hypothetical protein BGZ65_008527 [Modicella reniformis]